MLWFKVYIRFSLFLEYATNQYRKPYIGLIKLLVLHVGVCESSACSHMLTSCVKDFPPSVLCIIHKHPTNPDWSSRRKTSTLSLFADAVMQWTVPPWEYIIIIIIIIMTQTEAIFYIYVTILSLTVFTPWRGLRCPGDVSTNKSIDHLLY